MSSNTTLKKISDLLNVSISTVSRALKNHPDISDATKQRVQELAAMLEYEPNTYAQNLRTNNSRMFGVILPAISNYFYHSFIATLEEQARKHNYSLLILQSGDDPAIEQENVKVCRANRVAGLFVCISPKTNDLQGFLRMEEQGIPVIFFDKVPSVDTVNKVCVADTDAAQLAAKAFLDKSKKNILALFGNIEMSITRKRVQGFSKVFADSNLLDCLHIEYALSFKEAEQITREYFKKEKRPDAVFCMSDEILTGVMKVLQQEQIKIPGETAVLTISDGVLPHLYYPEISYIETSGSKLAQLAFTRMLSCLAGSTFKQDLNLEAVFIEGQSL